MPGRGRRPQFPQYLFRVEETARLDIFLRIEQRPMESGAVIRVGFQGHHMIQTALRIYRLTPISVRIGRAASPWVASSSQSR
jgi:hypothetical protein